MGALSLIQIEHAPLNLESTLGCRLLGENEVEGSRCTASRITGLHLRIQERFRK